MSLIRAITQFARAVEDETGHRPESIILSDQAFGCLYGEWMDKGRESSSFHPRDDWPTETAAYCAGVRIYTPSPEMVAG